MWLQGENETTFKNYDDELRIILGIMGLTCLPETKH